MITVLLYSVSSYNSLLVWTISSMTSSLLIITVLEISELFLLFRLLSIVSVSIGSKVVHTPIWTVIPENLYIPLPVFFIKSSLKQLTTYLLNTKTWKLHFTFHHPYLTDHTILLSHLLRWFHICLILIVIIAFLVHVSIKSVLIVEWSLHWSPLL